MRERPGGTLRAFGRRSELATMALNLASLTLFSLALGVVIGGGLFIIDQRKITMNTSLKNLSLAGVGVSALALGVVAGTPAQTLGQPAASSKTPPEKTVTTPETFVDALNFTFGKQVEHRATHAKGIVLLGKFTPSAQAADLSKAPHFKQPVSITVRFSDNTGLPKLPDAAPLASPHGFAIRFHLPDGTATDLVTHSYNGFPGKNADETRKFFIAVGSSGSGVPAPTPLDKFMLEHPAAKAFLTTQDPPPISYGTISYFGVNSFKFTNAQGRATFARYQLLPEAGRHFLSKEETQKATPNYLADELRRRVAQAPVRFKLVLQFAASGDKIDDPSVAWSDTNKIVPIGALEVTSVVPDSEAAERTLVFLPAMLPTGIEAADPMIAFRSKTYPVSYERRHKE